MGFIQKILLSTVHCILRFIFDIEINLALNLVEINTNFFKFNLMNKF